MQNATNIAFITFVALVGFAASAATQESEKKKHDTKYVCPPCGCDSDGKEFDDPGYCPSCGMQLVDASTVKRFNVAIVVFEGVELLDFAGPGETFASAMGDEISFNVYTVAQREGKITSQRFLSIEPEYTIKNCPQPDVLVIPGGNVGNLLNDKAFMDWAKSAGEQSDITLTVCNGTFVAAANGMLDGKTATSHHSAIAGLRSRYPKITVVDDQRFVDQGKIVTSAGVSAGIDGALHVVARLSDIATSQNVAHYMEYDWESESLTRKVLADQKKLEQK